MNTYQVPVVTASLCQMCGGTGTHMRGFIVLRLHPCRACSGARYVAGVAS